MKNLRVLLTISIAGTALLMSILIGSLVLIKTMKTTAEQAHVMLMEITERTAMIIESEIYKAEAFTDQLIISGTHDFSFEVFKGNQTALSSLEAHIRNHIKGSVLIADAKSGWFLMDPRIVDGQVFVSYYQDKKGILKESPPYDIIQTGVYKDQWYSGTLEKGEQWTLPYYWERWDADVISYCKRIEKDGKILGVAGTDLYMKDLIAELSQIKIYQSGAIILMDQDFNVLYNKDPNIKNMAQNVSDEWSYWTQVLSQDTKESGTIVYHSKGQREIIAYKRLTNGWILAVEPLTKEVYSDEYGLIKSILITICIGIFLSVIFALFLGTSVSKPFIKLNRDLTETNIALNQKNQEIEEQRSELDFYANNDALTCIPNRRAGLFYLEKLLALSRRNKTPLSIVFIDLDNLKMINDTYGHGRGDQALIFISTVITGHLRQSDMLSRFGGDEFLLTLSGCSHEQTQKLIEEIRHQIDIEKQQFKFDISFSSGIESYPIEVDNEMTMDEFIRRADEKMYQAKLLKKKA